MVYFPPETILIGNPVMENYLQLVKHPEPMSVMGMEALGLGERFGLFFKEFSTAMDRRMASFAEPAHIVDVSPVQLNIKNNGSLYVKNTGVEILTPEGYIPGLGNMMGYTKGVIAGVFIIGNLKTEAVRLYDWMKQIIKKGRMDKSFSWAISDFDRAVQGSEKFLKDLPDNSRAARYRLGQVYVNFDEFFDTVAVFNNAVKMLGGRDIEQTSRELSNVYELGQLLITKIKANDILLDERAINDIESIVNKFIWLTNIAGALMVLLNELGAVFKSQVETLSKLK